MKPSDILLQQQLYLKYHKLGLSSISISSLMAHIAAISFNRANSILELFRCDIFIKRLWEPLHGLLATCLHFLEYIAFSINIDQIR